jgi:WD40 repeat protein
VFAGAALALLALASTAMAGPSPGPAGPRLAVVKSGEPLAQEQLFTIDPLGEDPAELWRFPGWFPADIQRLTWNGDGSAIAWEAGFPPLSAIMVTPAKGGKPRLVGGTRGAFSPALSPDGESIAFGRLRLRRTGRGRAYLAGSSIWIVDSAGGRPRQLTPWQESHFFAPFSFAPDGRSLAAVHEKAGDLEVVSVPIGGGRPRTIVDRGTEPVYSPDGSEVAFVRPFWRPRRNERRFPLLGGDLYVAAADGSSLRRLTFSPGRREQAPSWDPSGARLVYTQLPAKQTFLALEDIGSSIVQINADGTCRQRLLFTYGLSYRAAAWQPGPGRAAGPIQC